MTQSAFEIIRNVKCPPIARAIQKGVEKKRKYPLADMPKNSKFVIPTNDTMAARRTVLGCIASFATRHPERKFATRKESDGIAVYRVA